MPTQNSDVSGDPSAIDYASAGLTWKIAKGVLVSGVEVGVFSEHADSTLVSQGTIMGDLAGVAFDPSTAPGDFLIKNQKSGVIAAPFAVYVDDFDGTVSLRNKGKIEGANAALQTDGSGQVIVENAGDITAELNGLNIAFATATGGADIENAGTLRAGNVAILSDSAKGVRFSVHNLKGGLIEGGGDAPAIDVEERLVLKNEGKINGDIHAGGLGNKIITTGKIDGNVYLGSGDDKLVLKDKGKVTGLIDAGPGNDKVVFGDAADKFLFDSGLDALTNVTTFKNFASGKDHFFLDSDIFPTITPGTLSSAAFHKGTAAADADDRIIYDKKSGALFYDPDGTGALAQTQFASFEKGTKLKASDFSAGEFSFLA